MQIGGGESRKSISAPTPWYQNPCDSSVSLHARPIFRKIQEAVENVSMSDVLSQLKQMNSLLVNNISAPKYPTSPQPNFWFNHPGQLSGHYPTQYQGW